MTDAVLDTMPVVRDELESPTRRALRRLFARKGAVLGLIVIATFIVLAVFAPVIVPYDPIATSWSLVRKPPSALHWFGTDDLGRDIMARVIYGARASLVAGAISVGIALTIGVPFGLLSGYRGGFIDALISRITDAMLACPFLILAWCRPRCRSQPPSSPRRRCRSWGWVSSRRHRPGAACSIQRSAS
jgi:peptide/nickel transport system permease protein